MTEFMGGIRIENEGLEEVNRAEIGSNLLK